jgi:hypothetical protein
MAFIIIWLCFGIASAVVAANKGRNIFGWFIVGVLLGVFALIMVAVMPAITKEAA